MVKIALMRREPGGKAERLLSGRVIDLHYMRQTMADRRSSARKKSFLQGRVYYNNQRSSVDCLVRDISEQGAKLVFADSVAIPDAVELHLPGRDDDSRR